MISVVVPIYNTEKYLKQCVDSILNQTYRDLDIILVDDGSTDSCGKLCDEYAKTDSRVRSFHIENIGISGARNYGIKQARDRNPKYIYFADSDDWLDLNMLEVMHNSVEKHNADIAVCGVADEFLDGTDIHIQNDFEYDHLLAMKGMLCGSFWNTVWNKIWKYELFDGIEFPVGMYYEDLFTSYRLFEKANIIVGVSRVVYHYRKRYGSIAHCHNIKRLQDYWSAAIKLYELCNEEQYSEYAQVQMKRLANIAINVWTYLYKCSSAELNEALLFCNSISDFAITHFSIRRMKGWPFPLKFGAFLVRKNKRINYFLMRFFKKVYSLRKKIRKLYD